MKLIDWVRELIRQNLIVTSDSRYVQIQLHCIGTEEIRSDRIRQDWWDDEDFRCGYEALRAKEGFQTGVVESPIEKQVSSEIVAACSTFKSAAGCLVKS